jgi:hypothetical protein
MTFLEANEFFYQVETDIKVRKLSFRLIRLELMWILQSIISKNGRNLIIFSMIIFLLLTFNKI